MYCDLHGSDFVCKHWIDVSLCQVEQGMFPAQQVLQASQLLHPKPIHLQDLRDIYLLGSPVPQQVVSNILVFVHVLMTFNQFRCVMIAFNCLSFMLIFACLLSFVV